MVSNPNLKKMEIMMNNVELMFSPTYEKTPYEQGEIVRSYGSVGSRPIDGHSLCGKLIMHVFKI